MSINPAQGISPTEKAQADAEALRAEQAQPSAPAIPISGTSPKQEASQARNASPSSELPQDEVQVQRDSGADGAIVIKYVDRFGDLVLQVPSSQVLGVARAIDQELAQEAKARAVADGQTDNTGGKGHGH